MGSINELHHTDENTTQHTHQELIHNISSVENWEHAHNVVKSLDASFKEEFFQWGVGFFQKLSSDDRNRFYSLCQRMGKDKMPLKKARKELQAHTCQRNSQTISYSTLFGVCGLLDASQNPHDNAGLFEHTLSFITSNQGLGNLTDEPSLETIEGGYFTANDINLSSNVTGVQVSHLREGGKSYLVIGTEKIALSEILENNNELTSEPYRITASPQKGGSWRYTIKIEKIERVKPKELELELEEVEVEGETDGRKLSEFEHTGSDIEKETALPTKSLSMEELLTISKASKEVNRADVGFEGIPCMFSIALESGNVVDIDCSQYLDAKEYKKDDGLGNEQHFGEVLDQKTVLYNNERHTITARKKGEKIMLYAGKETYQEIIGILMKAKDKTDKMQESLDEVRKSIDETNSILDNAIEKADLYILFGKIRSQSNYTLLPVLHDNGIIEITETTTNSKLTLKQETPKTDLLGQIFALTSNKITYNKQHQQLETAGAEPLPLSSLEESKEFLGFDRRKKQYLPESDIPKFESNYLTPLKSYTSIPEFLNRNSIDKKLLAECGFRIDKKLSKACPTGLVLEYTDTDNMSQHITIGIDEKLGLHIRHDATSQDHIQDFSVPRSQLPKKGEQNIYNDYEKTLRNYLDFISNENPVLPSDTIEVNKKNSQKFALRLASHT